MAGAETLRKVLVLTPRAQPEMLQAVAALDLVHSPVLRRPDRYAQFIAGGGTVLAAVRGDEIEGFAALSSVLDEGTLLNIVVAPEARCRGCGELLMRAVIRRAGELGLRRLLLEARSGNTAARNLYRAAGFAEDGVRRDYYAAVSGHGREDAVLMSLVLEESCAHPGDR